LTLTLSCLLRRRLFLAYGVYLIFTTLMWLKLSGLGYQYLWPQNPTWHKQGFHIIYLLTAMAAWYYTQVFFSLNRTAPRLNRLVSGLIVLFGLGLVSRLLGVYEPVLVLSFLSLASLMLLPVLGASMWYRGNRYARWFTVGWSVYSVGLLVSVLSASSAWLPWGMSSLAYTQAASLVEVLFLGLALADKLVNLERERTVAINLSLLDPLTGLGNRRELTKAYQALQSTNWSASDERVALLMIDLDHFKAVNDEYGHDAGDAVLKRLADELRTICRSSDTLVRFGGEEFAILLRLSNMAAAVTIAERIRIGFSHQPTLYEGQLIAHTLSIGIADVTAGGELMSTRRMMREADDALYYAKGVGRNSTVVKRGDDYEMCSQLTAGDGTIPSASNAI
ncbi:MAG: diguanylate cyclase, partial [Natronospirillum sp.]